MGMVDRRLRKHAHDIRVALPVLDHFGEHFPDEQSARYNDLEREMGRDIAAWGRELADAMEAGQGLPSLTDLHDWQRAARTLIHFAKQIWPEVVDDYIDGLDSKSDKRLMRSM